MRWRELQLERAPGVASGLSLNDCGPGLNVVFGPNGIGKSTLSKAARAALWRTEPFENSHLRGRVSLRGDEDWTIEREGARPPQWSGPTAIEPRMPDERFRNCFHLGLEDLLRQGGTDQAIAHELRLEMSGRYDLDKIAVEDRKRNANSHAVRAARRDLIEARKQVGLLEQTARELLYREQLLVPLEAELQGLQEATADGRALQELLLVAETEAELNQLRAAAADDDPLLARIETSEDFQRLREFEEARVDAQSEIANLRADRDAANEKLHGLALPEGGVDGATLRAGNERVRNIQRLRNERLPIRSDLSQLNGELQGLPESETAWSNEDLEAAQALLDRQQTVKARLAGIDRALELAETGPASADVDPKRSILALLEWCTSGSSDTTTARGVTGALVLAALVMIIAIGLSLGGLAVSAWVYSVPLALVIGAVIRARHNAATDSPDRAAAQRRFVESGAEAPRSWDDVSVRKTLEDLHEARAERDFEAHLRTWSVGLGLQRRELEREAQQLDTRASDLRQRLGTDDAGELNLRYLLRGMQRDASRRGMCARLADLERDLNDELQALQDLLESAGVGRTDDLVSALAQWDDFADRAAREPAVRQSRDTTVDLLREARTRASQSAGRRAALLEARRIDPADVDRALGLAPLFAKHRERRQRLQELEREMAKTRNRWADREDLLALDALKLSARLAIGRDAEKRIAKLQPEIAGIKADVRLQREDTRLTQREVELRSALDQLEETREAVLEGVAMDALLNEVQQRHLQEGRPKVLTRAERHFVDYTRNRYALEMQSKGELIVIETATRRRLTPDQLSSGTRTQLLIALRLAYAESIEGDDTLPIFLDEALLTSDPERFQEVARSLGRMVAAGRQVFYMTAEPREEVEWRAALGDAADLVKVHDLGGQLEALRQVAGSALEVTALPAVPEPVGDDSAAYATALGGMPTIDGFQPATALHLLQLYWDRPQTAHLAIREHRSQVGAVRSFLEQTADAPWDASERARFEAHVELADRVLGYWRIGRARPLHAEVLRNSSLAKSNKLEEVVRVAEDLHWSGDELLAALDAKAVKGLHGRMIESLREDLEAGDWLASGLPLPFDELLARALDDAESYIGDGVLTRSEARQLTHRLYQWLTPSPELSGVGDRDRS